MYKNVSKIIPFISYPRSLKKGIGISDWINAAKERDFIHISDQTIKSEPKKDPKRLSQMLNPITSIKKIIDTCPKNYSILLEAAYYNCLVILQKSLVAGAER